MIWEALVDGFLGIGDRTMTVGKVSVARDAFDLDARERVARRAPPRALDPSSRWTAWAPLTGLYALVMVGADVLAEAQRLRRDAERRYPHINFDT
jgi:hypothetical protein